MMNQKTKKIDNEAKRKQLKKVIDCHYCNYACCESAKSPCDCYVEDNCYFDHHVKDSKVEAENCQWFEFCDVFPKY